MVLLMIIVPNRSADATDIDPTTTRVSVGANGLQSNGVSEKQSSISGDGRYVAFASQATNLVEGDTNGFTDVFIHDLGNAITTRVGVGHDDIEPNKGATHPSISSDGRYVAFKSYSDNLVTGDTNTREDAFVKDRWLGTIERVNVGPGGVQSIGSPFSVLISGNGRFVFFTSEATDLVSNDTNGPKWDVFVYDRETHIVGIASLANDGSQPNEKCDTFDVSADGRFVAFSSEADNIVPGDANNQEDVFVHDRHTKITTLVSVSTTGTQGTWPSYRPSISADGRYIVFQSQASTFVDGDDDNAYDIFSHDRVTGKTTLVSKGDNNFEPSLSADGRYLVFRSSGHNWDQDWWGSYIIILRDLRTLNSTLISVTIDGNIPSSFAYYPKLSADGRYVSFASSASNYVDNDSNDINDIFLRGPLHLKSSVTIPVLNLLLE
jgi:Tol biopolymer transport system component